MIEEERKKRSSDTRICVDVRIRTVIENGVKTNHRSLFVLVGDKAEEQVVNIHYMMVRAMTEHKREHQILWCYKDVILGSNSKKGKALRKMRKEIMNGRIDANSDDKFKVFFAANKIVKVRYTDSHRILGNTFSMAVLQDFNAMTPNLLARAVETVKGGGLIIILLPHKDLVNLKMDVYDRYKTEAHQDVVARFNERFMRSLTTCSKYVMISDSLKILNEYLTVEPIPTKSAEERLTSLPDMDGLSELTKPLVKECATDDQRKALLKLVDAIEEKTLQTTVFVKADRGRGKSAALGLAIAAAVAHQYSNIFVTAPSPDNLKTLFEFVFRGFDVLGYQDNRDYSIIRSSNPEFKGVVVKVNITMAHRQTIQYIHPSDYGKLGQAELVCVDEAAAIPIPLVRKVIGPYLVFLSSTTSGYEGTGRSLTAKLIAELRIRAGNFHAGVHQSCSERKLEELSLEESIRYGNRDPVERWLNNLLCLKDCEEAVRPPPLLPSQCDLYYVNRDQLFSCSPASEAFLQRIMGLFVASHYKNSPNDLQMLADAPAHHIFVLLEPISSSSTGLPAILCAVQICLEGEISKSSIMNSLSRGKRASGDLIPWTISQQFMSSDFASLSGARIVRIATHPERQKQGYGARTLHLLEQYFEGKILSLDEEDEINQQKDDQPSKPPLLTKLTERKPEKLDYLGVSYGLTSDLLRFWKKGNFTPVYLRQTTNELTGEHTCIMLKVLHTDTETSEDWLNKYWIDFRESFMALLAYDFRTVTAVTSLNLLDHHKFTMVMKDIVQPDTSSMPVEWLMPAHKIRRLQQYTNNMIDYRQIMDLMPTLAQLFFVGRLTANLKPLHMSMLVAVGLQHRSVDSVIEELNISDTSAALAIFRDSIRKLVMVLIERQKAEVASTLPQIVVPVSADTKPLKPLDIELKEEASKALAHYAIKGHDVDWTSALSSTGSSQGILSVRKSFKRSIETNEKQKVHRLKTKRKKHK